MRLLRSFSRCFSSLGVLLLSSMGLRISVSLSRNSSLSFTAADVVTCASLLSFLNSLALLLEWNTIDSVFSFWCGTCAPRYSSELCSGCSSSCGRCLGSRSPVSKSQSSLQSLPVTTSCASSSSSIFTDGCGRWFFRRSPVVVTRSLSFFSSSLPRDVDVLSVLTSMLKLSWDIPLICFCAAALRASAFDLLCYSFYKCAYCFCCCCDVFSFDLIFRVIFCVMYFTSFFDDEFLLFQRILDIFLRARTFQYWYSFLFARVQHIQSSHVFFFSWHGCSSRTCWSRK